MIRNKLEVHNQCCGSGMFIPDPGSGFSPSRIPDPTKKEEVKFFFYLFNFLPTKYELGCWVQFRAFVGALEYRGGR